MREKPSQLPPVRRTYLELKGGERSVTDTKKREEGTGENKGRAAPDPCRQALDRRPHPRFARLASHP